MATLLLDRADLEVRITDGALALYEDGTRRQTVPLRLIDRVVIQGARTRLDSAVLIKLAEAGAATLLLSPRAGRQVAIVLGPAHNDAAVRLAQGRRVTDPDFCDAWARQLVVAKLRRQHRLLQRAEARRPDARKPLFDARGGIAEALVTTELGLVSAIPILLLHCAVKTKRDALFSHLEEAASTLAVREAAGCCGACAAGGRRRGCAGWSIRRLRWGSPGNARTARSTRARCWRCRWSADRARDRRWISPRSPCPNIC